MPAKDTPLESVREAVSSVLKRRVVKPTEQRRREILEAALKQFGEKGFQDTTVEDIANAAGVAKGTIYLYFPSKEHLLVSLKKAFMAGLVDQLTDIIAEGIERVAAGADVDYRDVIDDIFQTIVDYHCEHRDQVEVVVRQTTGPDLVQETLELERDFIALITSAFRESTDAGLIHTEDPETTARLVNAAIRDNLASCLCYGEPEDLPRLVEGSKLFLYKALAPNVELPPRRPRLVRTRSDR
jgi:AcrR family transcriptional regulator